MSGTDALIEELRRERDGFFEALSAVSPESLTTPGLVGEWSAREVIAHLGYWAGHAVEAIHAVEQEPPRAGRADTDAVNETVARVARTTDLATVRKREAASSRRSSSGCGRSIRRCWRSSCRRATHAGGAIRGDGPDHYREHAEQLRKVLGEPARG